MNNLCEKKTLPAQATLCVRSTTRIEDLPQVFGRSLGAVAEYLAARGLQPAGPAYAAYFNMDMQNLQMEAGFPTAEVLPGSQDVIASRLPGGEYASLLHQGSYDTLSNAYKVLGEWMETNGYSGTPTAYEFYLNDPATVPQDELLTEVRFPLF